METHGGINSAGKIKAHNLHLLIGDDNNQGNTMNGYPAGIPSQNAPNRQRPSSAGSHSSEDSRQMDRSPTGNQSDDSLEAEMKYQEELKERLRASFADLGMNPEGVLRDSLDEGDDDDPGLRDSLEDLPQNNPPTNQLRRESTFVKDDNEAAYDPQFQDSLDATQEDDNNNRLNEELPLQDSLDASKPEQSSGNYPNESGSYPNEPTTQDLQGYDKTIDDNMVTYPVAEPTVKRQSSGGSQRGNSKPSSRRNSTDSGNNSPKVSTLKRLKDNPSHRKTPPGLPNGAQERKTSGQGNSREHSAGSTRESSIPKPVKIPGINTHSRDSTPAKKVRERTRPKLGSKTHSKIHRLESGEEVRVEYISDDSGDEMHFVDEKGSPVDNFGLPLNETKDEEMPKQYRIMKKPAPPKEPSPREQQALNARRVSSGSTRVQQSSNQDIAETDNESSKVEEPLIQKTQAQQLGTDERTLPPENNRPAVFGEVRVSSDTDIKKAASGDSDQYNDLRFNMEAVKQAAAEQEAALRSRDNSGSKVRRTYSGNRNNSGNGPKEKRSKNADYSSKPNSRQNSGGQYQKQNKQQEEKRPQNDVRPGENKYHTPASGYSQRSDNVQSQYQDNSNPNGRQFANQDQTWQGPTNSSARQFGYDGPSVSNQPLSHGIIQPIRTQQPVQQQVHQLQSPPAVVPNQYFDYQQQQQPFNQSMDYQQPMQYGVNPNLASNYNQTMTYQQPVQSGFEPNLSNSFQPNDMQPVGTQQWQYQQQQQYQQRQPGFPQQPQFQQQFMQQPPSQPQGAMYGVPQGSIQGPVDFNQGGFNQGVMPQQQYYDQYNQQQVASAPAMDQMDFQMQGNFPPQMQQPQQVMNNSQQMPNLQPHPLRKPPPIQRQPPPQPMRQQPVRTGPDFIARNRKLQFGPPKKTYRQLYSMKRDVPTQTPPLNPNMPLPSISRENSQDVTEMNPYTDANDDEAWTRQLVEEQKQMALLMRGQSETNLLQSIQNPRNDHTQASWSADHATAYARMQASQQQQPRSKVAFEDDLYNSFESEDLRESWTHPNSKRTSPYPTLPGIPQKKGAGKFISFLVFPCLFPVLIL